MELTKEEYNELSARIDAGEFLMGSPVNADVLPALPKDAGDALQSFYNDCNEVISSYKTKMEAYEQKAKAAIAAANAKGMADMANAVMADFDQKLSHDFEVYKQAAEDRIVKLRADLAEARDISDNALRRCDDLSEMLDQVESEKNRLEQTLYEYKSKVEYYEALRSGEKPNEQMEEILGIVARKCDANEMNAELKEKEDEIRELKEQLSSLEKNAMVSMAFKMIDNGVKYLADIAKVGQDDFSAFGEKVLKHLLGNDCKNIIGEQNDDKLRSAISRISDMREEAFDAKKEALEAREKTAMPPTVYNVKQMAMGNAKFIEKSEAAAEVTKIEGECN